MKNKGLVTLIVVFICITLVVLLPRPSPKFDSSKINTITISSLPNPNEKYTITYPTQIQQLIDLLNKLPEKPIYINLSKGLQMTIVLNEKSIIELNSNLVKINGIWYRTNDQTRLKLMSILERWNSTDE